MKPPVALESTGPRCGASSAGARACRSGEGRADKTAGRHESHAPRYSSYSCHSGSPYSGRAFAFSPTDGWTTGIVCHVRRVCAQTAHYRRLFAGPIPGPLSGHYLAPHLTPYPSARRFGRPPTAAWPAARCERRMLQVWRIRNTGVAMLPPTRRRRVCPAVSLPRPRPAWGGLSHVGMPFAVPAHQSQRSEGQLSRPASCSHAGYHVILMHRTHT